MLRYIVKRLLFLIPIMLGATLMVFTMLYFLPGSAVSQMPSAGDGDLLDAAYQALGADDHFFTKYVRYVWNVFTKADFGSSRTYHQDLGGNLWLRMKITLSIAGLSLLASFLAGVPLGIVTALHQNQWQDRVFSVLSMVGGAFPSYWMALMILLLFCRLLRLLPVMGYEGPISLIMPVLALSLGGASDVARMTRSSMLETLDQEFVFALRAKGLRKYPIMYKHVLKNALVPVVTVLSEQSGKLIGGALVVELVFSLPGMGSMIANAVATRDQAVVLGCVVCLSLMIGAVNILADGINASLNPRIRAQYKAGGRET